MCARPSCTGIKHRHQETWQQRSGAKENRTERKRSESRKVTLSFILTPINQSCSPAAALLCCPFRRCSSSRSIWNRSEQRPKRAPQLGDPVGISGSKRQAVLSSPRFYKKIIQQKRTGVQHAAGASPRLRALWEYNGICWKGRHHVDIGSVPSLFSLHVPPDRLTVPQRLINTQPLGDFLTCWGSDITAMDQDHLPHQASQISDEGLTTKYLTQWVWAAFWICFLFCFLLQIKKKKWVQ